MNYDRSTFDVRGVGSDMTYSLEDKDIVMLLQPPLPATTGSPYLKLYNLLAFIITHLQDLEFWAMVHWKMSFRDYYWIWDQTLSTAELPIHPSSPTLDYQEIALAPKSFFFNALATKYTVLEVRKAVEEGRGRKEINLGQVEYIFFPSRELGLEVR